MAIKPSGSIKTFLETKKVETRILGPIERHLLTRPKDTSRRQDIIHPSELCKSDFCALAVYRRIMGEPVDEQPPGLRLQSIFDEGHAIHHKWQNWLREGGWLYGKWLCRLCHTTFWDTSPSKCASCFSDDLLEYKEVPLFDDSLMMAGHADGWIKGLGDDALIEIKSIGAGTIRMEQPSLMYDKDLHGAWRDIRRPFPTHLRQGNLYLELLRRMYEAGHVDSAPNEIVFIYELKADQSYKEFVVKADPGIVKDMLDTAYDIAHAVRTQTPLACTVDPVNGCKACNKEEK